MKKFLVLFFIFMFAMGQGIFAHSYIDSSFPEDGAVLDEPISKIELLFNAGIEDNTTIKVFHDSGKEIALIDKEVDSPHFVGHIDTLTEDGEYVVKWTALGSDGHFTEGEISFVMENVVYEEVIEEVEEEATMEDADTVDEDVEVVELVEHEAIPQQNSFSTAIVILILMVISISLFYLFKKVNKK